jgi:hypothetical protein
MARTLHEFSLISFCHLCLVVCLNYLTLVEVVKNNMLIKYVIESIFFG